MHSFCSSAEVQEIWISLGAGGGRGKVVEIKMFLSQAVSLQVATLVRCLPLKKWYLQSLYFLLGSVVNDCYGQLDVERQPLNVLD